MQAGVFVCTRAAFYNLMHVKIDSVARHTSLSPVSLRVKIVYIAGNVYTHGNMQREIAFVCKEIKNCYVENNTTYKNANLIVRC